MIDNYSDNKKKIKKIGGLQKIKIIFHPNEQEIEIKFEKKLIGFVKDFFKINILEYGEIFNNIHLKENEVIIENIKNGDFSVIKTKVNDYFDILQQEQAYIISP